MRLLCLGAPTNGWWNEKVMPGYAPPREEAIAKPSMAPRTERVLLLLLPQALRCVTCNSEDAWNTTSRWTSTWSIHARPKV